jgi:hypothetical protein
MEYLTKEEVVKIINRRFKERHPIRQPTIWRCMLTGGTTDQSQSICWYPSNATPKGGYLIIEFDAEHPDLQPPLDRIQRAVENSWNDFNDLSQLRRVDFDTDLLQENKD